MTPRKLLLPALLLTTCGSAASARGAAGDEPASAKPAESSGQQGVTFEIGTSPSFAFRSDLEDDKGRVQVFREGLDADLGFDVGDKLRLTIGFNGEVSVYDFTDVQGLAGSNTEPFDNLYQTGLSLTANYRIDDTWSLIGRGFIVAGFEEGASFGDSLWGGGAAGVGYKFSDDFFLAVGAGVVTRLDRQPLFSPLIIFNWRINEKLSLGNDGALGLRLNAKLSDEVSVYLRGGYEYRQYRLDDSNDVLPGGTVRDQRVPIGVGIDWHALKGLTLSLEGGVIAYQEYQFRNDDGNKVDEVQTDPAAYIGGRVSFKF